MDQALLQRLWSIHVAAQVAACRRELDRQRPALLEQMAQRLASDAALFEYVEERLRVTSQPTTEQETEP